MRIGISLAVLLLAVAGCSSDTDSSAARIIAEYEETIDAYCACVGQTSFGDEMICLEENAYDTTVAQLECALDVNRQYGVILDEDCLIEGLQATRDCVAAAECSTLDDEYDAALDCADDFHGGYDDCVSESRELSEAEEESYSAARSACFSG